eukprot:c46512_g1_i1 orf=49-216(+)
MRISQAKCDNNKSLYPKINLSTLPWGTTHSIKKQGTFSPSESRGTVQPCQHSEEQ